MKDLIKMLVEQALDDLLNQQERAVYEANAFKESNDNGTSFEEVEVETELGNTELSLHLLNETHDIVGYAYALIGSAESMAIEMRNRGFTKAQSVFEDVSTSSSYEPVAYFGSVGIEDESFRGLGLGKQLLDNMLSMIENYDPIAIVLDVMPSAFMNKERWQQSLSNRGFEKLGSTTMVKFSRRMNEVSAIGVGGGALQSSGKISGTGGNPLGKDMSKEHERMWSGDEEGSDRVNEERIGSRGSVQYFQMGSSLPDHLYNLDNKGRATRDPGLGGNTDKKKKNKREKKKKDTDRPGKRWYEK